MNKYNLYCSYRMNWLIFKSLWGLIFITLKLLLLISQFALQLG